VGGAGLELAGGEHIPLPAVAVWVGFGLFGGVVHLALALVVLMALRGAGWSHSRWVIGVVLLLSVGVSVGVLALGVLGS